MPDWILIQSSVDPQLELYGEPHYFYTISCLLKQVTIAYNYAGHFSKTDLIVSLFGFSRLKSVDMMFCMEPLINTIDKHYVFLHNQC